MPTLRDIRRRVGRALGAFASGVATGGEASQIKTESLHFFGSDTFPDVDRFEGWYVQPTSGALDGLTRLMGPDGYNPSDGTLTIIGAPWSEAPAAGMTFDVYGLLPPHEIDTCINDVLVRMLAERAWPLTSVPDGDMEADDTTRWTAISNATLAKATQTGFLAMGRQSLKVLRPPGITTAVEAESEPIGVSQRRTYTARVLVPYMDVDAVATLRVVRADASSDELALATWAHGQRGVLSATFGAPAGAQRVKLRLGLEAGAADTAAYFDSALLSYREQRVFPLPEDLGQPYDDVYAVYKLLNLNRRDDEQPAHRVTDGSIEHSLVGSHPWQIRFKQPPGAVALYITGVVPYAALSADTDRTDADLGWITQGALVEAWELLMQQAGEASTLALYARHRNRARTRFHQRQSRFGPRRPEAAVSPTFKL